MQLKSACLAILGQLTDVIHQMDEKDFCKPSETLSKSTVGQHLRHTVEFFICLEQGFEKGVVNYDKRQHDKLIESDLSEMEQLGEQKTEMEKIKQLFIKVNDVCNQAMKELA